MSVAQRRLYSLVIIMMTHPLAVIGLAAGTPRRKFLIGHATAAAMSVAASPANAETVGKDENCNDSFCLGVWDGILANCSPTTAMTSAGCVSSQDDGEQNVFSEPWDYSEAADLNWETQQRRLLPAIRTISAKQRGDSVQVLFQQDRYLRVKFVDAKTQEESTGEFYFTPDDSTVQYRVSSASPNTSVLSLKNRERCELIRKELGYLKLPVVRTRNPNKELSPGEWALAKAMGII